MGSLNIAENRWMQAMKIKYETKKEKKKEENKKKKRSNTKEWNEKKWKERNHFQWMLLCLLRYGLSICSARALV